MDVNELEVSALVMKEYLPEEAPDDTKALKPAIEGIISDIAFVLRQEATTESARPSLHEKRLNRTVQWTASG